MASQDDYQTEKNNYISSINVWKLVSGGLFFILMLLSVVLIFLSAEPKKQRLSLPASIEYGAELSGDSINAWEVYNFAGKVNQLVNTWRTNGAVEYKDNLGKYSALLTTRFIAQKYSDVQAKMKKDELLNRQRSVTPLGFYSKEDDCGAYHDNCVQSLGNNRWKVWIDVRLTEELDLEPKNPSNDPYRIKDLYLRIPILVVYENNDPEFNPWGLKLDYEFSDQVQKLSIEESTVDGL